MNGREIRMNIIMLGQIADILTTYIGLQSGFREGNPLMALGFKHLGFTGTAILKLGLATWVMHKGSSSSLLGAITWFAPINNIIGLMTDEPR